MLPLLDGMRELLAAIGSKARRGSLGHMTPRTVPGGKKKGRVTMTVLLPATCMTVFSSASLLQPHMGNSEQWPTGAQYWNPYFWWPQPSPLQQVSL